MLVLKIILCIVACILALILIMLFLPVGVDVSYKHSFKFMVRYCGIKIFSTHSRKTEETETEEPSEEKNAEKEESFLKKIYKQKGLEGSVRYFSGLLKIVLEKLKYIIKRIKIRKLRFFLAVSADDAAKTAMQYGTVCSIAYPAFSDLLSLADCKPEKIDISADFNDTKPKIEFSFNIRSLPIFLCIAALGALWEYKKYEGVNFNE